MLGEIRRLVEARVAQSTLKRPFSRVSEDVALQIASLMEPTLADGAFVSLDL